MRCFDVTMKGFSAFCDANRGDLADSLGLVKWVKAPSLQAVQLLIERHSLMVDGEPSDMGDETSDYEKEDGVDLVIDDQGNIIGTNGKPVVDWNLVLTEVIDKLGELKKC